MQNDKTGEGIYRKAASYSVAQVSINGNKGVFYYRDKNAEKDEKTGKYPKIPLTSSAVIEEGKAPEALEVVFLKIRRVISVFKKGGEGFSTNEHNNKNEMVMLFGKGEIGIASELREKYPELRTQQIVYCYLPLKKEIVRVVIKGSSLGSEETAKGVLKFYDYLGSFGKDEHSHEFITRLQPIAEEGPESTYYAISFERGRALNEEEKVKVNAMIDEVYDATTAIDESFKEKINARLKNPAAESEVSEANRAVNDAKYEDLETIEYPEEDINPEDIPF